MCPTSIPNITSNKQAQTNPAIYINSCTYDRLQSISPKKVLNRDVSRTHTLRLPAHRIRDASDDVGCKQPVSVF